LRSLVSSFLTVVFLAVFCAGVSAAVQKKVRGDEPIQIKSNELSTDNSNKTATFVGKVVARQADITIYCDRLVVHYGEGDQSVERVEAFGNVQIFQVNRRGYGGKAEYDNRTGIIVLLDNPRVYQGDDMVTGKIITVYVNEDRSVVSGAPDRRVEAVIHPKAKESNVGAKP
jgi:lipopolysaccharide export system protein LptA